MFSLLSDPRTNTSTYKCIRASKKTCDPYFDKFKNPTINSSFQTLFFYPFRHIEITDPYRTGTFINPPLIKKSCDLYAEKCSYFLFILYVKRKSINILTSREYSMIYRGPGFLTVVWFGSSPTSLPTLIKKKEKISSSIRKFTRDRVQSHLWLTASS
jgi:hypothetical protein